MIKIENTEVLGWEHAIRGMRNPMNSWEKSDSTFSKHVSGGFCWTDIFGNELPPCSIPKEVHQDNWTGLFYNIGSGDLDLMTRLRNAGTDHRKFMRMIVVYVDITAPLYWWKEFDTYKVGTVANSCSTMHKIAAKEFTLEDFSHEHLDDEFECVKNPCADPYEGDFKTSIGVLLDTIEALNWWRKQYLHQKEIGAGADRLKWCWWQMIQLLPSSYNQKRTVMLNYEVLANIYKSRRNHKLDEWAEHKEIMPEIDSTSQAKYAKPHKEYFGFCDWIKTLPYSKLITGEE